MHKRISNAIPKRIIWPGSMSKPGFGSDQGLEMEGIQLGYLLGALFLLLLAILWIVLPFAVFGIKGRLDALIKESEELNQRLGWLNERVNNHLNAQAQAQAAAQARNAPQVERQST